MTIKPLDNLKYYLELGKLKIMIPVSLTGFTGYFIFDPQISINSLLVTAGVLFTGMAASVLNQIQEVDLDKKMNRTMNRPLAAGSISPGKAFLFFLFNLLVGISLIFWAGNFTAAIIALLTIFWYNVIYTYSKRITAFAVVPGAVTGALPPLIGWIAAGGGFWDKPIIFLEFLLFIGQVPHFWLLILKYGEEYKSSGMPSLTQIFSETQIKRLTFTWVIVSVAAAIFLGYFEIFRSRITVVILIIASALILSLFSGLLRSSKVKKNDRLYFILLDAYFLLVLLLLIIDRVIA